MSGDLKKVYNRECYGRLFFVLIIITVIGTIIGVYVYLGEKRKEKSDDHWDEWKKRQSEKDKTEPPNNDASNATKKEQYQTF